MKENPTLTTQYRVVEGRYIDWKDQAVGCRPDGLA
jgi:hypothetical protein